MLFVVTFCAFALLIAAMAFGVLVMGKKLQGSCGGAAGSSCACSPEKREQCRRTAAEGHDEHEPAADDAFARHADTPIDPRALARARHQS
jgi:hypothetical protein